MKTGVLFVDIRNDYFLVVRMELAWITEASLNDRALLSIFREKNGQRFTYSISQQMTKQLFSP